MDVSQINQTDTNSIDDKSYLDDPRLKALKPAHRMVMICFLNGMNQTETAEYTTLSVGTVSKLWNNTDFRSLFEELDRKRQGLAITKTAIVKRRIIEVSTEAQEILITLMKDNQTAPSIRADIAKNILDRAGHKPKEEVSHTGAVAMRVLDSGYDPKTDPFMQYTREFQEEGAEQLEEQEEFELDSLSERIKEIGEEE